MRAKLIPVLACAVALATASASHAAIVPGVAVDGPDSDIVGNQSVQVDIAPDGTTALAYLKAEGGEDHVFVSLFAGGAWGAPFQADTGSDTAASALRLAVANGGKVVVTFKLATGAVVSRIKPNAAAPFGVDRLVLANGEYANIDLAPNGNGYAAGRAPTNDVFATRLEGETWTPVAAGDALNSDATQDAGGSDNNIRVATSPDGASAVVAWGEVVAAGGNDVFARRLTGTDRGPAAAAHLDSFPGGTVDPDDPAATQPDVGIDGAGTAWVVFRNNVAYGMANRPRAVARPFTGDAFGPFQTIDGAPEPPTEGRDFTRVDVNAAGQGVAAHHGNLTNGAELATLAGGTWTRGAPVETETNDSVPFVIPAIGENGSGLVTWIQGPGGATSMLARTTFGGLGAVQTLSNPDFGPTNGPPDAAAGPGAFAAVTFLQQEGAANRRVVAAIVDLPQPPQPPPPPNGNGDEDPPDLTDVRMAKRFRKGGALPRAAQVRTGTRIRYTLSEAATVTLAFSRATRGRRVGGRCVKRTRRNRGRRPCTRFVRVRPTLAFANQQAGARRIRFAGRLTRRRSLRPGPHRLTMRARDAAGNLSQPVRVRFRLLPRG